MKTDVPIEILPFVDSFGRKSFVATVITKGGSFDLIWDCGKHVWASISGDLPDWFGFCFSCMMLNAKPAELIRAGPLLCRGGVNRRGNQAKLYMSFFKDPLIQHTAIITSNGIERWVKYRCML
jgi:hypothetical protein